MFFDIPNNHVFRPTITLVIESSLWLFVVFVSFLEEEKRELSSSSFFFWKRGFTLEGRSGSVGVWSHPLSSLFGRLKNPFRSLTSTSVLLGVFVPVAFFLRKHNRRPQGNMRLSAVWVAGVFIFTSIFSWLFSSLFRNQSPSRLTIAEQFTRNLGAIHPIIFGGTLRNASLEASATARFLLVCLHSPETVNSEQALECLANENVNQFINENFIFWPAMRNTREGAALARQFAVRAYPHFQVLARVEGELVLLGAVSGPMSPDTLLGSLLEILDEKRSYLEAMRAKNERQEMDRTLMASQNDEFQQALEEDRAREEEEQAAIEESKRLKKEEEEREAEEERERVRQEEEKKQQALKQREIKKARLPVEPARGEGLQALISIRVVGGKKISRRFLSHDTIQTLYDFVDTETESIEPESYLLFSNFPRREYDDLQLTLELAGLCPNAQLDMRRK